MQPTHVGYHELVTQASRNKTLEEILRSPLTVLLGVTPLAAKALAAIHIDTVFDLAASATFHAASAIATANGTNGTGSSAPMGRPPLDVVDDAQAGKTAEELAGQPVAVLRMISDQAGADVQSALSVGSLRDLSLWPPFHAARSILAEALGRPFGESGAADEAPADLIPATGQYATERVRYQSLLYAGPLEPTQKAVGTQTRKALEDAGPVDVTQATGDGFVRPALGAALTYSQSWYAQGVALGQLLHSVALAPGESTRIAMVDWSRRAGARITEAITETEQLRATLTRNRALREVVSAVANETQTGRSQSWGVGASTETGSGAGAALDLSKIANFPLNIAAGVTGSVGIGGSFADSWATSTGHRDINATTTQNILDSTHQAASSTRDRWATVVREVSQEESEQISTRALTNFNHMHALTVQYYEVVQMYRTVVALERVERCLFLPMKTVRFEGTDAAVRYRFALAQNGLIPEVRALAYAETDSVIVTAPNRAGPWEISAQLASYLSQSGVIVDLAAAALVLPDDFTVLDIMVTDPTFALKMLDIFDRVVLRLTDGKEYVLKLLPMGPGLPGGLAERPPQKVKLSDVTAVTLMKKSGQESWSGTVILDLTLDPASGLIRVPVSVPGGADQPQVRMQRTYGKHQLLRHLEDNALYYSQVIWRSLDVASLGRILDAYTIMIGGTRRTLAEVCDLTPVGVVGNYVILRMPAEPDDKDWTAFLQDKGLKVGSRQDDIVPLPTGGVFAEAVLGRFNSAEKIDLSRFWNWQDSPIPITAPEISAIQSGSRAQPEGDGPGQLGTPVVNIQNAPSLPDPQGLAAALQALANGAMFRDMSGLAGTQNLARAFLEGTMRGATEAGRQAGQNMQTATDFASRMAQSNTQGGSSSGNSRWGGASTPNSPTVEGGRLNYGRDLDQREMSFERAPVPLDETPTQSAKPAARKQGHEAKQYDAGVPAAPEPTGGGTPLQSSRQTYCEVRLRLFIPAPAVAISVSGVPDFPFIFTGDPRTFSYDGGTDRAFSNVLVSFDDYPTPLVQEPTRKFGITKEYDKAQGEPVPGKPSWYWRIKPGQESLYRGRRLTATDQNNRATARFLDPNVIEVALHLEGRIAATSLGLQYVAPAFDADFFVTLRRTGPLFIEASVQGEHDLFPAYELYVNGFCLYEFDPLAAGTSPSQLFGPLHTIQRGPQALPANFEPLDLQQQ
jgi:hypothetical protein